MLLPVQFSPTSSVTSPSNQPKTKDFETRNLYTPGKQVNLVPKKLAEIICDYLQVVSEEESSGVKFNYDGAGEFKITVTEDQSLAPFLPTAPGREPYDPYNSDNRTVDFSIKLYKHLENPEVVTFDIGEVSSNYGPKTNKVLGRLEKAIEYGRGFHVGQPWRWADRNV